MKEVEHMNPGCVIGEAGFFLRTARGASIEAVKDSEIAVLNHTKVHEAFEKHPESEFICMFVSQYVSTYVCMYVCM
jgi:CRP-like cAMP-binding protein